MVRRLFSAALLAAAVTLAACGGSSTTSTTTSTPTSGTGAATTPSTSSTPTPTTSSSSAGELSGKWKGQYGGAYGGTFVLNWQQSGVNLRGTIALSAPPVTLPIHGTLNGTSISFGTVGSLAITYTGSVSGSSMSGSYQTPTGGGPWSASKG
jgi:hypothetical protein